MKAALALCTSLVTVGLAPSARADECSPARLEIILDRSSSMQTGLIGGVTKWSIARSALGQVTAEFQSALELGLVLFPRPDECAPGDEVVAPALGNRTAIMDQLATPPPTAGNWTPMAQTLAATALLPSMNDGDIARYAVLVSDGWQWCSPYDPDTRFDALASLDTLNARGVTTFVVGFGDSVDALTLNALAVNAGTARPGCDPTGDSPTAANPCYYQADDAGELVDALRQVAGQVADERCDGRDNDCDGLVDEDLVRSCDSACGSGSETCVGGGWTGCDAPDPGAEACDGIDNDCDGTIDPGCACEAGEQRACGDDACGLGSQTCGPDGTWSDCVDDDEPSAEQCDGVDNDCDGQTDEYQSDDEVGSLCPPGLRCDLGDCVDLGGGGPPDENGAEGDPMVTAGCGCRAGGTGSLSGLTLLVGALVLARRRRRRR